MYRLENVFIMISVYHHLYSLLYRNLYDFTKSNIRVNLNEPKP